MAFLKNTISLLAVFCVIPAAFGASARVGVVATTASRMPTLRTITGAISSSTTPSSDGLMGNTECIDAYTECIKSDDVCGSNLEECTTNVLFHGKMPLCFSTLYQCSTSGINTLFGTSAIDALSNVATKNNAGEVTRYTYPTDGSVLGQLIIGAKISNQYKDSATCVKKYKSCMYRDTVCGEDFELCTDANSFKKQAPTCDSVLALCPSAGVTELFGVKDATTRPVTGFGSGVVAEWVSDGADLAAANAVNTCYKVVDNCFLSACGTNPYRCVEDVDLSVIETADIIGAGESEQTTVSSNVGKQSASDVRKFFKSACIDTIGTNKYCYMTFNDGKSPKKTDLTDPDNQEDLFSDAYTSRKTYINTKLQTLVENFDTKAKKSCTDAIKSCAMRSCGGGSGAACYTQVFGDGGTQSINSGAVYTEIKRACEPVINTNPACRYSAAAIVDGETYSYTYIDSGVFTTLFGDGTAATFADPIGAVAALNSSLATTYNAAGIAQLQKQCENVATNCVKSMCGTDYVNCYRSRNDVSSAVYTGEAASFNKSMNKLGGVLDYNVILGLCQNTVKNSPACEEHLSIVKAEINEDVRASLWGTGTVADSWLGTTVSTSGGIQATDANGAKLCQCAEGGYDVCEYESNGVTGCSTAYMTDVNTAVSDKASATLFQNLLAGIEKEAQGLYQGKLTKQRNMCEAENNGGIVGASDMTSSTFMWAKLAGNGKVPNNYSTQGLSSKQFVQTNDLYGGFCRIRIDVKSSDIYINQYLGDASVRYFAAGDAFTCGSWITNEKLTEITEHVAANAVDSRTKNQQERTRGWITALGTIGGAVGGFAAMDAIQNGKGSLGGLLSNKRGQAKITAANTCQSKIQEAKSYYGTYMGESDFTKKNTALNNAITKASEAKNVAQQAGIDVSDIMFGMSYTAGTDAVAAVYAYNSTDKQKWSDVARSMSKVINNCRGQGESILTTKYKELEDLLNAVPTNANDYSSKALDTVNVFAPRARSLYEDSEDEFCKGGMATFESAIVGDIRLRAEIQKAGQAGTNASVSSSDFDANIKKLETACSGIDSDEGKNKRMGTNLAVGAVLGAGLGVTSYLATRDIQLLKNEKAEQDAIDEWMNNIGDKIKCYIGSEEVGSYGDIISTEL